MNLEVETIMTPTRFEFGLMGALVVFAIAAFIVSLKVLNVLRDIKKQQRQSATDATTALTVKLDELYGVEAVMARADKLSESARDIVNSNRSKELVRASMLIVQAAYAMLIKQTTDAMVATRRELSAYEELHAEKGRHEHSMERCRTLLSEQEQALRDLEDMQQNLLSAERLIG